MPRTPQDVTDAELAILQVLWSRRWTTVRELTGILYPERTKAPHATVQKLLGRLEAKKCVKRNRGAWPHVYEAVVAREDLIGRRLQETADELCDGSLAPLLTHLVSAEKLSRSERESLRELLDRLEGKSKSTRKDKKIK